MIAKSFLLLCLLTVLPPLWIDRRCWRCHPRWLRLLCWLPTVLTLLYMVYLALLPNWVPDDYRLMDVWFLLLGVLVIPQTVYALSLLAGYAWQRWRHGKPGRLVRPVGLGLAVIAALSYLYGFFWGFARLEVRHLTLMYDDLPSSFDGYRIVHVSDLHVGTFQGWRSWILDRDIDSINAQRPDLVLFTGDLQNFSPQEIRDHARSLGRMQAQDGVVSILGNHDYGKYADVDERGKAAIERAIIAEEEALGWTLLRGTHHVIRHGNDSIVIVGEEYDTSLPNRSNPYKRSINATMAGIAPNTFLIMLEHNPEAWLERVIPSTHVQLQLSGHTHAGHVDLLGLRLTRVTEPHDYGLSQREGRYLYTTSGLGGVIPVRLGAWAEIAVITLKKKPSTL